MNKYQEAIDVMARYISDNKRGIERYSDKEIDDALAKIVELEEHHDELSSDYKEAKITLDLIDSTLLKMGPYGHRDPDVCAWAIADICEYMSLHSIYEECSKEIKSSSAVILSSEEKDEAEMFFNEKIKILDNE